MAYVYIIESQKDKSFYIGSTRNLSKRIAEHNAGLSKYTSCKLPWKIVYFEEYPDMKNAMRRESFLKKQRNRKFYKKLILIQQQQNGEK